MGREGGARWGADVCLESEMRDGGVCFQGALGKLTSQGIWRCRCVRCVHTCMFVCACVFRLHKSMSSFTLNG